MTPVQFIATIDRFIAEHPGMTATKIGIEAMNDPCFVKDVRTGRNPSLETAAKVLAYIDAKRRVSPVREAAPA